MAESINWDKQALSYQQVFKSGGISDYSRRLMEFFCSQLGLEPGCRVIDIGCGVGKYGTYFAAMGCDVTLTDISGEMLRHAKENMAEFPVPCTVLQGDFNELSPEHPAFSRPFKLSISTMSPAVNDISTIRKMSGMTEGHCFISRFIHWEQPNRDEFYRLMAMPPLHTMDNAGMEQRFKDFVAMVKEAGYEPHIRFEDYNWLDLRSPQEAVERLLSEDISPDEKERALAALRPLLNEDGLFPDGVNTRVAWIYWSCPV